jgi:deoxyribodipyrimidine photo-lyase
VIFFKENNISWKESQNSNRKLKSRQNWDKLGGCHACWTKNTQWAHLNFKHRCARIERISCSSRNKNFQQGGEHLAWRYLDSFVKERYVNYSKHISKPALSGSHLSPYLTYGISMRMIYQYTNQHYENSKNKRAILNFVWLHWHCHFIQKFEECRMEFEKKLCMMC